MRSDWDDIGKIAILGAGQMGVLAAWFLADPGLRHSAEAPAPGEVWLWGFDEGQVELLRQGRSTPRLPGATIPESVRVTRDPAQAVQDADVVVCATPTQFITPLIKRVKRALRRDAAILNLSKGMEVESGFTPTQVIFAELDEITARDEPWAPPSMSQPDTNRAYGALAGPMIARELARGLPAVAVLASNSMAFAQAMQRAFSTPFFRVYSRMGDVIGVEYMGAYKHMIAIAAGILDGLGAGCNAKSALLARGLAEMAGSTSLELAFGAAGVGDLATSCFSPEGRNRALGESLGKGLSVKAHLATTDSVVEGVDTTRAFYETHLHTEIRWPGVGVTYPEKPIAEAVYSVLFQGVRPVHAIERLMQRPLKEERFA